MICPFPPGSFPPFELPLLSVFNDVSRGMQFFSVAVLFAAALVPGVRLLRRLGFVIGLMVFCCLVGCTRTVWSGQCGRSTTGCEQEKPQNDACLGWTCEK